MSTFCQGCGNEVSSQYKFCPLCGGRDFTGVKPNNERIVPTPQPAAQTVQTAQTAQTNNIANYARVAYSGFWRRAIAMLIDALVLLVPIWVLIACLVFAFGLSSNMLNIGPFVLQWLYFAGMESSSFKGTVGKRAMDIRVCDMNGDRISFGRASGRYFGKILSGLLLLIGYLMVAFTERKQGLHDIMAGTVVLHRAE